MALILDGLDEMDEALRPAALQALSDAPFRVVVLTRSPELVQAASQEWLVGAVAVHLHDVTAPADYLRRARTSPPPSGWPELLSHLHEHPEGTLARGLSTPLTLTLLRDTYQPGDDVSDLLDPTRYRTTEAVEHHLIARVLPAAYTPRAGRSPPRYTLAQAHQTLTFLARRMNQDQTRDLAWWHIPRWAPRTLRILAGGLALGLAGGLITSATARTTLAWLQLWIYRRIPAVGLMSFLEDAQERGVLRTVGAVYQFRHATLQDQLADETGTSSPTTSAVPRTS